VDPALARREAELLDDLRGAMNAHQGQRAKDAERQLTVVWNEMAEKSPQSPELSEYLGVRRVDAVTASELSLLLESLSGEAGIVEYYLLNRRLLIYTLSPQTGGLLKVTSNEVGRSELHSLSNRLLAAFRDRSNDEYAALSEQMGEYILSPVEEEVGKFGHVHFVPHGFLHQIPIHALPLKGRALLEEHTISYSQSASILRYLAAREKAASSSPSGALVVGDTTSDLRFARAEAQKIAALLETEPIIAEEATKERVISSLKAGGRKKEKNLLLLSCQIQRR
jgi:CHAT domain-containing protein